MFTAVLCLPMVLSGGMIGQTVYRQTVYHRRIDGFQRDTPIGILLDLDEGTLTMYQNGQRIALLKDGLSGEYCWYATVWSVQSTSVSIERSFAPDD